LDVLQGSGSRLVYEALLDEWGGRSLGVVTWAGDCMWCACNRRLIMSVRFCDLGGGIHAPYKWSNGGMMVCSYHRWYATISHIYISVDLSWFIFLVLKLIYKRSILSCLKKKMKKGFLLFKFSSMICLIINYQGWHLRLWFKKITALGKCV
jgi:hypothetical protein